MYNSIQFNNGLMVWVTQEEADSLSQDLLAEKKFIKIDRLQKTYNTSEIHDIGPNTVFFDPLVRGGEFSFAFSGLYAKLDGKEYTFNKGWKLMRGVFELGKPFAEFINLMTVPQ